MADRQSVIDLVTQYVASGKEAQATKVIAKLVDSCVKTIASKSRWSWRETNKDDYSFTAATSIYNQPSDCVSILAMGQLEDGLITQPFFPMSEQYFTAHSRQLTGLDRTHYIPLAIDATTKIKKFRLYPLPASTIAGRVKYIRAESKDDIRFIGNEMLIVYCMLGAMPNEFLSADPKVDVVGRFYKLYQDELTNEISKDEPSREMPTIMELSPRAQTVNNYLRKI